MIMVGGGARDAGREVGELARRLRAPVVSFRGGRGIVDDDDPYGFTGAAGFRRWAETDVLLGIGSRLELAWLRWPGRPAGLKTVLIDIDPVQAVRLEPDVSIVADAREAAAALAAELGDKPGTTPDRSAEFRAVKEQAASDFRDVGTDLDYLAAIRAALPADGFFVEEICRPASSPTWVPRTRAAPVRHLRLPGHARVRLPHLAGREGRLPRPARGVHRRRRRVHVRHRRTGHRRPA